MKLRQTSLSISAGSTWLEGLLAHSPEARGLILIPQMTVGHHRDSREAYFSGKVQEAGFATLLFDLLTHYEETRDPDTRFNTPLLGQRIGAIFEWLRHQPPLQGMPLGLVSSGTGSAGAIRAMAREPEVIHAFICRGGRPGLAGLSPLRQVICPTRMIVGEQDEGLNSTRQAFDVLGCLRDWQVIPGCDDGFRAPGSLERTAALSAEWFAIHLPAPHPVPVSESPPVP